MAAPGLVICDDISATTLRALARRERSRTAAARMYAVANALAGMSRAEAARLAGLERQALRDAVVRYNAEGQAGLQDRPRLGPKPRLDNDEHAVMVLDQAGWHGSAALMVPGYVTLMSLPPYAPQLNPIERVWLYLLERHLSQRLLAGYDAIVDACCNAWNQLTPKRLHSLTSYPYLQQVNY